MYVIILNFTAYNIYNLNTGLKHLQTHLNVLAQLLARTNMTIAPSIVLNIMGLPIKLFILRSSLYNSTMFLYLKWPLLLKIQFLQTIPLLNLNPLPSGSGQGRGRGNVPAVSVNLSFFYIMPN